MCSCTPCLVHNVRIQLLKVHTAGVACYALFSARLVRAEGAVWSAAAAWRISAGAVPINKW
jgi:hypothetical protein